MSVNRGVRNWQSLFPEDPGADVAEERSQGRDEELIALRNVRMVTRLAWYKVVHGHVDYGEVKRAVAAEFDLSLRRLENIMAEDENTRLMRQLWNERPAKGDEKAMRKYIADLERKYYWMDWERVMWG